MKPHILLYVLVLVATVVSCMPQPVENQITESQLTQSSLATRSAATASAATVIAASGDGMIATDPATFFLNSGGLQLVEFFSFT